MRQSKNLWEYLAVLGLAPGASADDVRTAYRSLVKQWHPDKFTHDRRSQIKAEEKLKEINEAYAALRCLSPQPIGYQTPPSPSNKRPATANGQARRPYNPHSSANSSYRGQYRGPFQYQSTASWPRPGQTHTYTVTPQEKAKLWPWLYMMFMLFTFFSNIMHFDTTDYALPVVPQAKQSAPHVSAFLSQVNESSLKPKEETSGRVSTSVRVKQPVMQVRISEKTITTAPWQVPYSPPAVSTKNFVASGYVSQFKQSPAVPDAPIFIKVGSTKQDVLAIQGKPTSSSEFEWRYGASTIRFLDGRVTGWTRRLGSPLKVLEEPEIQ